MEEHVNTLKHSNLMFDTTFYDEVTKAAGQKDFVVNFFLTWSLNQRFEKPATVERYPDKRSNVSVPPNKICIFQLIHVVIIIFKFGRIVYLHLKPYKILNLFVLNMAL